MQDLNHCKRVVLNSLGSAISFASSSLQTKLTDGYAPVRNIEEDSSPEDGWPHPRSTVPALTGSAPPAFKHSINIVANCVSGIRTAKSLH